MSLNAFDEMSLRAAASRNAAMGGELFRVFFESAQDCVTHMQANIEAEHHRYWHRTASLFKDLCLSLGAITLAELCLKAQHLEDHDEPAKIYTLVAIRHALRELAIEVGNNLPEE